jgi:hypothetical protein
MSHPLIENADKLTIDELQTKLNDLNKKLGIASRSGNGHLCNQIRMAIDTFQNVYNDKLRAQYKKDEKDMDKYTSKIDIS